MKKKITAIILCAVFILSLGVNSYASSINQIGDATIFNINDEVFSGYEGLETTVLGKVGFNVALNTTDNKHTLLLGFTPYDSSDYSIATGWRVKLPYLDIKENGLYRSSEGYVYLLDKDNKFNILNYPSTYILTTNGEDGYALEKVYGSKEYFSNDGSITEEIDEFGNITKYFYKDGDLYKILYADGTFVTLEKSDDKGILIKYIKGNNIDVIADITVKANESGLQEVSEIKYGNDRINFSYMNVKGGLLLKEYVIKDDYKRTVMYDNLGDTTRIKSLTTYYEDGNTEKKEYFYDSQNRLERLVDGAFAEETYTYIQEEDGSLTTNTTKKYNGNTSFTSETINKVGQTTKYVNDGTVLELKYNRYNKISEEKENGKSILYSYTEQGNVSQKKFSNGDVVKYDYYANGEPKRIISGTEEINYSPSGAILSVETKVMNSIDLTQDDNVALAASTGVKILYNINSNVGVTNFHTYYGLSQTGFNCYTFAIAKHKDRCNPGYYSGRSLNLSSLSGIKLNVEKDQAKLGRTIYDSTVGASMPVHSWKIALRIKSGYDYHFMKISNSSSAAWQQKAGKGGPVMQLRGGKTPSSVSWDTYIYNSSTGKYKVGTSGFYNSAIKYMIIKD